MNFALSEEQTMVKKTAARFANEVLKPRAAYFDETHEHPAEACAALGELGFMGIAVPEKYGGANMDYVSYVLALSEVSRGDASVGVIMSVCNSLYCYPIMTFGTDEQKQAFLTPVASGQKIGCYGLTEAGAGSDPGSMRTIAVLDGNEWVLNGEKKFITNGNVASYAVIAAVTDKFVGNKGISSFIVDLESTNGFKIGRVENKMGICASGTAELIFEDARIPKANLLGQPGFGLKQMLITLDSGRIGIGSQALGIGRAVLEEALEYAKTREQFSQVIIKFQSIQWKLADMAVALDAAELLLLRAAWMEDQHMPFEQQAAMAKMFAADAAMAISIEGVQILGGYGYCRDYPMERHMRDAKITQIYEGTNEIMRLIIARNLMKGH